jgi:hypothetical protein
MTRELGSPSTPRMREGWPTEPAGGTRWSRVTPRVRPPRKTIGDPRNSRKTRNRRCAANKNHRNPVKMRSRQRREEDGDDLVAQQPVGPTNAQRPANEKRRQNGEELGYAPRARPPYNARGPTKLARNTDISVAPQAPQTTKKTRSGRAPQESREDAEAAEEECALRCDRAGWMGQESGLRKKTWSYGSIVQPRPKLCKPNSCAQGADQ